MSFALNSYQFAAPAGSSATHVFSDAIAGGASIPLSTNGAQVGDLLILVIPYYGAAPVVSGSGWTISNYAWSSGLSYTAQWRWKVLDNTTDVTISNATYGSAYFIYRGPTSVNSVVTGDQGGVGSTVAVTMPSPSGSSKGFLIYTQQQYHSDPSVDSGYTQRLSEQVSGVFLTDQVDLLSSVAGGLVTVSNLQPGGTAHVRGLELL